MPDIVNNIWRFIEREPEVSTMAFGVILVIIVCALFAASEAD